MKTIKRNTGAIILSLALSNALSLSDARTPSRIRYQPHWSESNGHKSLIKAYEVQSNPSSEQALNAYYTILGLEDREELRDSLFDYVALRSDATPKGINDFFWEIRRSLEDEMYRLNHSLKAQYNRMEDTSTLKQQQEILNKINQSILDDLKKTEQEAFKRLDEKIKRRPYPGEIDLE